MVSNRHSAIESNNAFTAKVEDLVREIVIQNNILYYRIESRLEHHTNVGGEDSFMPVIRVITYFEDTVSQIADLLNTEFEIVAESAVDKKKSSVDSFSYKHIQYLVGLKANRRELTEYKRSGDKKFEVQICSMLQDAWAGIEKELGYDSESFPEEGKRDLYRVGALLEMADLEFLKIRSKFINEPVAKQQPIAVQAPVTPVINEPAEIEAATDIYVTQEHTFSEPVAEVEQEEAPEPEVVAEIVTPPVAAAPQVIIDDIADEPVAIQHEEIKEVVAAPVIAVPEVVFAPAIAEPEVIAPIAAIPEPEYKIAIPEIQHIVPKRAMPEPAKAPAGIAPKRTIIEVAKTIANALGASYGTEHKNGVSEEKAAEIKQQFLAPEVAAPVIAKEIQKEPQAAPVEILQAKVEVLQPKVEVAPPAPVQHTINVEQIKVDNVEQMKVNLNGNIEKADEIKTEADAVPFFEDMMVEEPTKAVKPVALDENAPITDASLKEYVLKSKLLKEVDKQIAERAGAKINPEIDIEGDVERLRFLKVYTLKQLHDRIKDNSSDIVAFAEKWIGKDNGGSFDSGISLFYLEYLLVGKKNDPAFAVEYVVKFISDNDYSARYIIPTYNSIRNTEAPNFSHLTLK